MLNLNDPSLVEKAQIEKCVEVQNDKVLWTMYYDTNGYEIKHSFYSSYYDETNKILVDGFYGVVHFENNENGQKIEKKVFSSQFDTLPYYRKNYSYDKNNKLIAEETRNEKGILEVTEKYYYSNDLLLKKMFKSSHQTVVYEYSYNESDKLVSFSRQVDNNAPELTEVTYNKDTTFYKSIDNLKNEVLIQYKIVDENGKLLETMRWDKLKNQKSKTTYIYNENGLLTRMEKYNFLTKLTETTYFQYE
jgi:hypothetical protein